MNDIFITVEGVPVPKKRPRFRILGKGPKQFVSTYTPAITRTYEEKIKEAAVKAMEGRELIVVACRIYVRAFVPIPKSMPKKLRALALTNELHPITRPDADNYLKTAMDALNEIVFKDDSQCWRCVVERHYAENPRMEIEIKF